MKFIVFENDKTRELQSVLIDDDGKIIVSKKGENGQVERTVVEEVEQAVGQVIEQIEP